MKLTFFFLTAAFLQVSATGVAQSISYSGKNVPITSVFSSIEKQTGFVFFYNTKDLVNAKPVTLQLKEVSLEEALHACLKDQPLTYAIKGNTIFISAKSSSTTAFQPADSLLTLSPPIDITGKVKDAEGKPLVGANVKVKGTNKGTTTGNDGVFVLRGIDQDATLEISFVGYETYTIEVNNKTTIVASLKVKPESLNEVVINKGYYSVRQRENTGNVSTVKSADIEKQPVTNPLQALEGRVPGMVITQSSGVPGSSFNVLIRGRSSIDGRVANDPLYIVDGVPFTSTLVFSFGLTIFGRSDNGSIGNPFNYLNPADIESIDILKDADATAIYGSRGANGVVLITTKKGKAGKTKFDFDMYSGVGKVGRKLDMLNTKQYLQMREEAFINDNATPQFYDYDVNGVWDTTANTDWQKKLIGGTARFTNIQGTVSGGNANIQYLIGGSYHRETTVFHGNFADQKGGIHFNVSDHSTDKRFSLNLSGSYVSDYNHILIQDMTSLINTPPDAPPIYNSDGSLNWSNSTWTNPFSYLLITGKFRTKNLISNISVNYQVLQNLMVEASAGYTNLQSDQVQVTPMTYYAPAYQQFNVRTASFNNSNIQSWILEPKISYHVSLAKASLKFLVGATVQQDFNRGQVLNAAGFSSDLALENIQAAPTITPGVATDEAYKYNAVFGRINYNLSDRYIINLTGRRDGSSRFGPDKQFHNFGAAGLAWIFSNTKFIQKRLPFLSYGKLRSSYGTTGNDQIGNYRFLDLYTNTVLPYQGSSGLTVSNLFNPELAWEINKKFEVGAELGFFEERMNLSVSYYQNRSSSQLVSYSLPGITGFTTIDGNLPATVENKGLEIVLNTINVTTKNFRWATSFNLTLPHNKLIAFPGLQTSPYSNFYVIGEPITIKKVYEMIGVDPTSGQYQFGDVNGHATFNPQSPNDAYKSVNVAPTLYGGIQNSIHYKRIQLDFLFQFIKQTGLNYLYDFVPGSFGVNQPSTVLNHWQKPGDNAPIQRFNQDYSLQNAYYYARSSDQAYSDASYIRLKNAHLSYQLPESIFQKVKLQGGSIYIEGQNLLTITNYKGLDPENQSVNNLPPLRIIVAGINISF